MWVLEFIFKKRITRNFSFLLLIFLSLGFRIFPGNYKWDISTTNPTLWVRFCELPVITTNDLPASDPLYGQTVTFASLIQSIYDDYNNLPTSLVELKAATDPSFTDSAGEGHTIEVCFTNLTFASGLAGRKKTGEFITSCTVRLDDDLKAKASRFVGTFTHELGHCMGLDHVQELTGAIMSYFRGSDSVRLAIDDKAGLTFLYPSNPDYAVEAATFGLSCAPKN